MDIKPDNVFRHAGLYKLGDFGLTIGCNEVRNGPKNVLSRFAWVRARPSLNTLYVPLYQLNESSDVIEGDSQYLAPELLQGRGGMAADIFSLGISLLGTKTEAV